MGSDAVAPPADPLAAFSDNFAGSSLDAKWTVYEGALSSATTTVGGGVLRLEVAAGGTSGSFWYNAFQGVLVYQEVEGDFDVVATLEVFDAAGTGSVPLDNYRLGGIAAHDPDRATVLNYVHVALGSTAEADLRCEWKTTVDSQSDSGTIETGEFGSISAPTGAGQVRILREGQVFTVFYRATSGDAWTTVQVMDRTSAPMPDILQVGPMLYSNLEAHDISVEYDSIVFSTP